MQTASPTWTIASSENRLLKAVRWLSRLHRRWRTRSPRQLQLCESLALGERRFVAIVQCEQRRFLIGATANSVVMLTQLSGRAECGTKADQEERE